MNDEIEFIRNELQESRDQAERNKDSNVNGSPEYNLYAGKVGAYDHALKLLSMLEDDS